MAGEKREHRRVKLRQPARVRTGAGDEVEVVLENLGALGAMFSTLDLETPLDVGDRLTLTVPAKEGVREVAGEILRSEQEFADGEIRRAFAVRFDQAIPLDG